MSGIYAVKRSVIIDRELRCQTGLSLREWADRRGIPFNLLIRTIDEDLPGLHRIKIELADALGVSALVA